jgi:hypothetical protein
MEDFEFIRRLRKRGRIVTAMNQLMLAGYYLGISPHRLARFYRRFPRI